jgi:hypothetical protein
MVGSKNLAEIHESAQARTDFVSFQKGFTIIE